MLMMVRVPHGVRVGIRHLHGQFKVGRIGPTNLCVVRQMYWTVDIIQGDGLVREGVVVLCLSEILGLD